MIPELLKTILSTSRPYQSYEDEVFIDWLVNYIKYEFGYDCKGIYSFGGSELAIVVTIGDVEKTPILFSCHTDTAAKHEGIQEIEFDAEKMIISLKNGKPYQCLGADDGAGIFLMLEMIKNGVNGTYLFHRGEECGFGSMLLAKQYPSLLTPYRYAIAFDREATYSVITHQLFFGRCCSDEFGIDLAKRLSKSGYEFCLDTSGVYTDVANYAHIIPECANISVGYYFQHTNKEYLDLKFLLALRDVVILNETWENLPIFRLES